MKRRSDVKRFHELSGNMTDDRSTDVKLALTDEPTVEVRDSEIDVADTALTVSHDNFDVDNLVVPKFQRSWTGSKFDTLTENEFLDLLPVNSYFH